MWRPTTTVRRLQKCFDEAQAHLADTDVAMFYYSGHGIQIKDENYLVATDAGATDFSHGFVPVQPIVDAMQKQSKATLVLLDACRNNPMAANTGHAGLSVSTGRGLARVSSAPPVANIPVAGTPGAVQARGLMVAYATSPNAVAQDGTGALSPFTAAFVKTVGTSGFSIQRVMSDVTKAVGDENRLHADAVDEILAHRRTEARRRADAGRRAIGFRQPRGAIGETDAGRPQGRGRRRGVEGPAADPPARRR